MRGGRAGWKRGMEVGFKGGQRSKSGPEMILESRRRISSATLDERKRMDQGENGTRFGLCRTKGKRVVAYPRSLKCGGIE